MRADQQERVRSGGYKASGIGREFGAVGLGQYVEYKTIAL